MSTLVLLEHIPRTVSLAVVNFGYCNIGHFHTLGSSAGLRLRHLVVEDVHDENNDHY